MRQGGTEQQRLGGMGEMENYAEEWNGWQEGEPPDRDESERLDAHGY
jgi:hypothetical protein